MRPLTEAQIRAAFVNVPPLDAARVPMPGLHEAVWADREYLGWRDSRSAHRAYVALWHDDRPVAFVLLAGSGPRSGISAMCSLCQTAQPGGQVALFAAPKAGAAGENGDTVGTYICADLGCSAIIRIAPPSAALEPSPAETVLRRIAVLRDRVDAFTGGVLAAG